MSTPPSAPPADPASRPPASTIGELRASGWRSRSVKAELRANLLARLGEGAALFPGVIGYGDSVLPAVENAILAGQDLVFLGERGQGKTRMARLLVGLLDPWLPIVAGGELNDDPFQADQPFGSGPRGRGRRGDTDRLAAARPALRREAGDAGHHDRRPDRRGGSNPGGRRSLPVGRARPPLRPDPALEPGDLRDQRAARPGRADPGRPAQHPGGARRPDPGFTIRLPLDLFVVASANPEDYTSRGRIITPLKDRLGSQIRTHYPRTLEHEIAIVRQEKVSFPPEDGVPSVRI